MPRLTAERSVATKAVSRPVPPRPRAKKPAAPPDRLSARKLFLRRVRRSVRPGLWVLGAGVALALISGIFHAIPANITVASPAGSIRHGFASLAGYAGFRVANIQINGAETTPLPVIEAALGVQKGDPIFGLSLAAIQTRVERLGPVRAATVERALPGTLIINVTERSAYAIWQTDGGGAPKFVIIDAAGNVITDQDAVAAKRHDPSLLLLAGPDAPANAATLMNELKAAPPVLARVVAAERVDGLRWNLTLKDQALVKLPAENEQAAIGRLASLQGSMALLDRPVEVIDLRLPGRLVVRPYPAAAGPP